MLPRTVIDASLTASREVWDEVMARPEGGRLLVVHNADRVMPSGVLPVALEEASLSYPVVFTTADPAFARKDGEHIGLILDSRKAQLVRCVLPSREEDTAVIVASWWPSLSADQAVQVLDRCGGSLRLAREACDKGTRTGLDPRQNAVVCRRAAGAGFSDLVVAGERKAASTAAASVPREEVLGTLRLLGSRLSLLALLNLAIKDGMTPQQQAAKLRADAYALRLLRPHARDYSLSREAQCREVLAMAELAVTAGAREGVLEAVALLW